jgi:hypothetical protein
VSEHEMVTVTVGGQLREMRLDHAIELAQRLNAAVARHVNQRQLTLVHDATSDSTSSDD